MNDIELFATQLFRKYNYSTIDIRYISSNTIISDIYNNLSNIYNLLLSITVDIQKINNYVNIITDILLNFSPNDYDVTPYTNRLMYTMSINSDIVSFINSIRTSSIP